MTGAPSRPVMRYHGGKWRLAKWVIAHFPAHRVYVEPFGGAASVLMQKARSYAEVYNDLDGEIVNVFRVLREPESAARLEELIRLTPFARAEYDLSWEDGEDAIEQARRTIVRAFMGFGSAAATGGGKGFRTRASTWRNGTGFRSNWKRSGTTPAHDWARYPSQIGLFCERLCGVVIECKAAAAVMIDHDAEETLHYIDPPYVFDTRGRRHEYRHEMTDEDHRELAAVARALKGMVVISGYPSGLYDEFYGDWVRVERKSLADGARARVECLWISPRAAQGIQGRLL